MRTSLRSIDRVAVAVAAALTASHFAAPLAAQSTPTSTYTFVDEAFSFTAPSFGSLPNGAAHAHDVIVSHAGWQYTGYWDAQRRLAVARRDLAGVVDGGAWQVLAFDDYAIPGEDAHNTVNIGVCSGDGTLHLAFDHHGDDLNYRRSVPGLATDPVQGIWSTASFGPVLDTLVPADGVVTKVTYPRFVPTPDGDLHLIYREFSSGNGRARMVDYDSVDGTWSNDRVFIERTGAHSDPLGGASPSRNPYFNRIEYDDQGTLQATWTWREKATIRYNRDICYAYSEDGGVRWFNGAHELVADTSLGQVIDAATPGIVAVELGAEWGLMNDQGHVVDGRGNVHVVMYYKDVADTQVSYGNVWNSHYRHHWLAADGVWRSTMLDSIGNRPKLVAGPDGTLVLAYAFAADVRLDTASEYADWTDWTTSLVIPANVGSSAQVDRARADGHGLLDIAFQDRVATLGDTSAFGVFGVDLDELLAGRRVDGVRTERRALVVEQDAWVGGAPTAALLPPEPGTLVVRGASTDAGTQLAFVRLHLADLHGLGAVERAVLRLVPLDADPAFDARDLVARRCALDAWPEDDLTWDTRPVPDAGPGVRARRVERSGRTLLELDVTEVVRAELENGGQRLTLELSCATGRWIHLAAREHDALPGPTLDTLHANGLAAAADSFVRSGIHADTNYGGEPTLRVKEDGAPDYDRMAYLRFDAARLRGTGAIERVFLELDAPIRGDLARTTPYAAHAVADDGWDEFALTWNTAPALGERLDAHFGRATMRWNVTAAVLDAIAGDGALSIAVRSERSGAPRIVHLRSRESPNVEGRPRLVVRYAE